MKQIAIEDIATVFASEFVRECRDHLQDTFPKSGMRKYTLFNPFLKMNYMKRRKLVEKVLDKMEKEGRK